MATVLNESTKLLWVLKFLEFEAQGFSKEKIRKMNFYFSLDFALHECIIYRQ